MTEITCDVVGCRNPATYELEWQEKDGFESVYCCDDHFPTDPEIVKCYCNIRKLSNGVKSAEAVSELQKRD